MGVQLNPGFTGYVAVLDSQDKALYKKRISTPAQAKEFYTKYSRTVEGWGIVQALLIPTRTNTLENLAKDLFLPTLVNHALKVENVFVRVLACFFAAVLDIATFSVRVITAPFRITYNYVNDEKHPLSNIVRNKEALEKGEFTIQIHIERVRITPADYEGIGHAVRQVDDWKQGVTTRVLPGLHQNRTHSMEIATYIGANDEWVVEGVSTEARSDESFST